MRRFSLALLTMFAVVLALAGCGGHAHRAQAGCAGYQTPYGCQAHSPSFGVTPPALRAPSTPTIASTLEMADSVNPGAYPLGLGAGAGYTSGFWVTYPFVAAHYRYHVSIAVNAAHTRDNFGRPIRCLDVEPGDASPQQAGPWDRAIRAIGGRPCDYENVSTLAAVEGSIRAAGLRPGVDVDLFVADWTFRAHLYPGSAATQWTDHGPHGENFDESTVTPAFLGIKPPPLYPICFTHRLPAKSCAQVKAKVASQGRAAASSERAYAVRGCPALTQRIGWFSSRLKSQPRTRVAYRKAALAASRRAYQRQSCGVFAQRASYFTAAAGRLKAAN